MHSMLRNDDFQQPALLICLFSQSLAAHTLSVTTLPVLAGQETDIQGDCHLTILNVSLSNI